jgi:TPP-dependent pyruvate/acetoin dehydrogenase alpha subunit
MAMQTSKRSTARAAAPKAAAKGKNGKTPHPVTADTVTTFEPAPAPKRRSAAEFVRERAPDDVAGLSKAQLVEIYRYLFETRRLEEHLVALYRQNQVVGGVYGSLGQEGTAIGCAYAMKNGDYLQPLIRDMGAALVHGATPLSMLRQYMARGTGPSAGRDLNTHFSDPSVGILGPVSMLGAMVPVIAGCLLAAKLRGEKKAGIVFIGDGGSSTGAFYEGMNFASVQKLPLIAVIEANRYAYSTPTTSQVPNGDLVQRARGFGCTVAHVDGNDALACYEATRDARVRAMAGEGPTIIVVDTYRRKGHAEHDNQAYVPEGEIADWAENNDPIKRYVEFLVDNDHASQAELDAEKAEVEAELNAARDQSVPEPFPDPAQVTQGVFEDGTRPWPPSSTWFRGGPPHRED